jgi:hypothetical protein
VFSNTQILYQKLYTRSIPAEKQLERNIWHDKKRIVRLNVSSKGEGLISKKTLSKKRKRIPKKGQLPG